MLQVMDVMVPSRDQRTAGHSRSLSSPVSTLPMAPGDMVNSFTRLLATWHHVQIQTVHTSPRDFRTPSPQKEPHAHCHLPLPQPVTSPPTHILLDPMILQFM